MSNTSSMPHNFISLAQGWSHCTCCSVQEDSRWQGEEGARPPHADLWAHGWDKRGAHHCGRGKACWGVVGCRKGRTREPGSRELERTAPLERWTPPGNEATWGGEVWKGGFHLHLRPQLRLLVVAELHYLTLIKRTTMVDDDARWTMMMTSTCWCRLQSPVSASLLYVYTCHLAFRILVLCIVYFVFILGLIVVYNLNIH